MLDGLTTLHSTDWPIEREESAVDSRLSERFKGMLPGEGVPLDELADHADEVRALIRSGEARLEVVVSPWGLEFNLVPAGAAKPSGRVDAVIRGTSHPSAECFPGSQILPGSGWE